MMIKKHQATNANGERNKKRKTMAVKISTSGYCQEILARQLPHLPRKKTKLKTGTKSTIESFLPQTGQSDRPVSGDLPVPYRKATTFKKLPTTAPIAKIKKYHR